MESRSAAAISDVRNQTSEALEALERRVDEGLARNAATQSAALDAITMSLMDMEGRLEASSKASIEAHAKSSDELSRRASSLVAASVAAQANRLQAVEAAQASAQASALENASEVARGAQTVRARLEGLERQQAHFDALEVRLATLEREPRAQPPPAAAQQPTAAQQQMAAAAAAASSMHEVLAQLEPRLTDLTKQQRAVAADGATIRSDLSALQRQLVALLPRVPQLLQLLHQPRRESDESGGAAALKKQVASLRSQCDAADAELAHLRVRMPGGDEAGEEPAQQCVGVEQLSAALSRKLDRDEWAHMRDGIVQRIMSQIQANLPQQQQPQLSPGSPSNASLAQRRPQTAQEVRQQAWAESEPGGGSGAAAASRRSDGMVETRRLVDSKFVLRGEDGRMYRGATNTVLTETHPVGAMVGSGSGSTCQCACATTAAASRARLARPASAGVGAMRGPPAALQRPGSAGASKARAFGAASSAPVMVPQVHPHAQGQASKAFARRGEMHLGVER